MYYSTFEPSQPATICCCGAGLYPAADCQSAFLWQPRTADFAGPTFGCGYAALWGSLASCARPRGYPGLPAQLAGCQPAAGCHPAPQRLSIRRLPGRGMLIPSAVCWLRGYGNAIEPAGSIAGGGLPTDTAAELSALAERLATLSPQHRVDWSDSWTDEDLQDFRAASLRRLETEESEESQ